MKYLTFEQWIERNPDVKEEAQRQRKECPECKGEGEHKCECPECGDVHYSLCTECESPEMVMRQMYDNRLKHDKMLAEKWTTIDKESQP